MKKASGKITLLLALVLVFSFVTQFTTVFAASLPDLYVSKSGKSFKVTKGTQSYSFRYDWDKTKKRYTGYSQKKVNKLVPSGPNEGIRLSLEHENAKSPREATIAIISGVSLNKKIYRGLSFTAFDKRINTAWGNGCYKYWNADKQKSVRIGKEKLTNRFFKKNNSVWWEGDRGRLRINISISWNKEKKRAEVTWIEMWVNDDK